jgi:hypothetical protein
MPILEPAQDFFHPVGKDAMWNESYYFNCCGPQEQLSFVTRIGVRANIGVIEYFLILILPDGTVTRLEGEDSASNDPEENLNAGGLCFNMIEPMKTWHVSAQGVSDDGRKITFDANFSTLSPSIGVDGSGQSPVDEMRAVAVNSLASGHFEQAGQWSGNVSVGGVEFRIGGFGNRDKSWGARKYGDSRGMKDYRWFSINLGESFHIGGILIRSADEELHRGWKWRDGNNVSICRWDLSPYRLLDQATQAQIDLEIVDKSGQAILLKGEILKAFELNVNEKNNMRVVECVTRWKLDEVYGYGIIECATLR